MSRTSGIRGWCYLVYLSLSRQARVGQLVWIAIGLLGLSIAIVAINTRANRWTMDRWRFFGRRGPTLSQWMQESEARLHRATQGTSGSNLYQAIWGSVRAIVKQSDFLVFSRGFIILLFVSFLLPVWSLAFATSAIGMEIEDQSLLWIMTRPLPRWSIYLAKFIALLPWTIGFILGGFALLCLAAGRPGPIAFQLFWPAIFWGALAFSSLFLLMGAFLKRPAIMAIVYSFFLEVIAGNMPGTFKRISFGFYTRCIMFENAEELGLQPADPLIYEPVSSSTAQLVLLLATIGLLLVGMVLFERKELSGPD